MTTVSSVSASLGVSHKDVMMRANQKLDAAQSAFGNPQPTQSFGDRIADSLQQVAGAQNGAADLHRLAFDSFLVYVSGCFRTQLAIFVVEHQEATFCASQLDDGIHYLIQHFTQV